jgi:hypothetical protein
LKSKQEDDVVLEELGTKANADIKLSSDNSVSVSKDPSIQTITEEEDDVPQSLASNSEELEEIKKDRFEQRRKKKESFKILEK